METLVVTFNKRKDVKILYSEPIYINSRAQIVVNSNDYLLSLGLSQQQILNSIGVWISEGSGWTISSIDEHYLNVVAYEPLRGNSYIPFTKELRNGKKGLINIKNNDDQSFRRCHVRLLNPQEKNPQRIKKTDREMVQKLNYQGIEFPVSVKDYTKIEAQNNINVNVVGYEDKQFYPIFVSKQHNTNELNLLLITEEEKQHYVFIADFNRMMFPKTKHKKRKYLCMHCLQCFSTKEILTKHKENCIFINGEQAIMMPEKGKNILQFKNHHRQMPVPFVIYVDF